MLNLPLVTKIIIGALVGIYLLDLLTGHVILALLAFRGLAFDPLSLANLVTYGLVHASFGHLAMNLVGVAVLGKVLESRIGGSWLVGVMALGTAVGAAFHIVLSSGYLIGISAGVGALYGVALPAAKAGRFGQLDRLIVMLALLFVAVSLIGLVLPIMRGVAHAAHLGGFLTGLLLSHRLIR